MITRGSKMFTDNTLEEERHNNAYRRTPNGHPETRRNTFQGNRTVTASPMARITDHGRPDHCTRAVLRVVR